MPQHFRLVDIHADDLNIRLKELVGEDYNTPRPADAQAILEEVTRPLIRRVTKG